MAYVRSTDGSDADDGSTWALAEATLVGAAAADAAGDTVFVSDAHAESTAGAVTLAWAGTAAAPTRVICGDDAAEPPTAVATTATVTTTGNNGMNLNNTTGAVVYYEGISFFSGTGASSAASINFTTGSGTVSTFKNCALRLVSTSSGALLGTGNSVGSVAKLMDTSVRFAAASQYINATGHLIWSGGSIISGGTSPTTLIGLAAGCSVMLEELDLSNGAAAMNITASTVGCADFIIRNSKLPASWSGALNASTAGEGTLCEMFNCDSGDTNYKYRRQTKYGQLDHETTIVRTGGASDGVTPISWKMVTNAGTNTTTPVATLNSPEIQFYNSVVGSSKTVTIEIVHDSVTALTDSEVWLEVAYLGTSGFPLGLLASDMRATVLTTPANQSSSSETWTTTGLTNPNKQALSVTFTAQEIGFYIATIRVAKLSYTVYVCPKPSTEVSSFQVQIPGGPFIVMPASAAGGGIRMAGHGGLVA